MNRNKKVIIVSNRLPVKITENKEELTYRTSEGGLATGLGSIYKQNNNLWIGWPGGLVKDSEKDKIVDDLAPQNLYPIFLNADEINDFYEGFSNETLWPLFHYFPTYTKYEPQYWESYVSVNQKFANAIIAKADKGDTVWIHDYQLLLVPQMVRKAIPEISIGFFQHIPFPSYEIFRLLPWRKELLAGILGADLVAFHTYDDVRHFLSATGRILNADIKGNEVMCNNRSIAIDAFPMGIDYSKYNKLSQDNSTRRNERKLRKLTNYTKLLISIDRLDYSKGITQRLKAYELLLENHPELLGKVTLVQLVVPSRDTVKRYKDLKEEMNTMVSEINGRFSTLDWQPINHFYRSFPLHLLSALYKAADVALVTPMRDGMNLVSKEYIASKTDQKGVLILSEMAGASRELSEAISINPNNIWDFADKIYMALNMPETEQKRRMISMQRIVSKFNIYNWVDNFMSKLQETKTRQEALLTRSLNADLQRQIRMDYSTAAKRLILLDYDGTLVPFQKHVNDAIPDNKLLALLTALSDDEHNKLVIISGRDYNTLDAWLGHLHLDMIAEHGAWYKIHNKAWQSRKDLNNDWRAEMYSIMELFCRRTPGSFIEEKTYSLAWHYRNVEEGLGLLRAQEIIADLKHFAADKGLQILQGDKVIEIKSISINKGKAAKRWLDKEQYDFILAIGDDYTDEDTFKAMPENAVTIKVGSNISAAKYYLSSYKEVCSFLQDLNSVTVQGLPAYEADMA